MARIGGDIDSMSRLRDTFRGQAEAAQSMINTLDGAVGGVDWEGGAATNFKGEWEGSFKKNLNSLVTMLSESSREVDSRIEALRAAGGG